MLISAYPRRASEKDDARRAAAEDNTRREIILCCYKPVYLRISFHGNCREVYQARDTANTSYDVYRDLSTVYMLSTEKSSRIPLIHWPCPRPCNTQAKGQQRFVHLAHCILKCQS